MTLIINNYLIHQFLRSSDAARGYNWRGSRRTLAALSPSPMEKIWYKKAQRRVVNRVPQAHPARAGGGEEGDVGGAPRPDLAGDRGPQKGPRAGAHRHGDGGDAGSAPRSPGEAARVLRILGRPNILVVAEAPVPVVTEGFSLPGPSPPNRTQREVPLPLPSTRLFLVSKFYIIKIDSCFLGLHTVLSS